MAVSESFPWNAFQVMKVDYRSYLQHLAICGTPRWLLQMHFEFELQTLMCMLPINLDYPTFYDLESEFFMSFYVNVFNEGKFNIFSIKKGAFNLLGLIKLLD
jgi:hypothetical protein